MQIDYLNSNYLWGNFQPSIQLTPTYEQLKSSKINDLTVSLLTRKQKFTLTACLVVLLSCAKWKRIRHARNCVWTRSTDDEI